MVWGMSLPATFGQFWPSGEFEWDPKARESGWSERLEQYFLAQSPERQMELIAGAPDPDSPGAYSYYVAKKLNGEARMPNGPWEPDVRPIEPQEPPRSFTTDKKYQSLGSLIHLNSRMVAVDDPLKTIIERLEPGVHQFFPIDILMPKGEVFPKKYHVLVIGQYYDSFSPEHSNKESWSDYGPNYPDFYYYKYEESKKGITGLAVSESVFGSSHLWRERRFLGVLICFSDSLQAEITKAGLRLPAHYPMKCITP